MRGLLAFVVSSSLWFWPRQRIDMMISSGSGCWILSIRPPASAAESSCTTLFKVIPSKGMGIVSLLAEKIIKQRRIYVNAWKQVQKSHPCGRLKSQNQQL
jgi:hypothetical protein